MVSEDNGRAEVGLVDVFVESFDEMELDADDEDPLTINDELAALALLVPEALVAVEENVYAVPLVSPVMVQLVAGAVMVHVAPPGLAVTV